MDNAGHTAPSSADRRTNVKHSAAGRTLLRSFSLDNRKPLSGVSRGSGTVKDCLTAGSSVTVGNSSPNPPIIPSICDVCQGLVDMNNPRWFVVEQAQEDASAVYGWFISTFVHCATRGALLDSAQAGCSCCKMFYDMLWTYELPRAGLVIPNLQVQAMKRAHDAATAARLAKLGKREGIYREQDLSKQAHGRVVIHFYSGEASGQWWGGSVDHGLVTCLGVTMPTRFNHFHTSGESNVPYSTINPDKEQLIC